MPPDALNPCLSDTYLTLPRTQISSVASSTSHHIIHIIHIASHSVARRFDALVTDCIELEYIVAHSVPPVPIKK